MIPRARLVFRDPVFLRGVTRPPILREGNGFPMTLRGARGSGSHERRPTQNSAVRHSRALCAALVFFFWFPEF